jgi:hypothetical protein
MSSAEIYAKEVHDELQRYATWLPTERIKVGDVGILRNHIFSREAHLTDFGITAPVVVDPATNATYKFMSADATETQAGAGAAGTLPQGVTAKVDLKIGFGREDSVYFLLAKCVGSAIENQLKLGSEILKRVKTKEWKLDYVVVTRVVTAGSATILQAKAKNASIIFEGDGKSTALQLLNAGASLGVKAQSSIGFSIVTKGELTPLMTLGKVDYGVLDWFLGRGPDFSPATNVKTAKIGIKRLRQLVASTPDVEFAAAPETESDHERLTVMIPKYGDYVDVSNIVDFAINAHGQIPVVTKVLGGKIKAHQGKRIRRMSSLDQCNTRIQRKRIRSLVNKASNFELESQAGDTDYMLLNVTLPKTGAAVDFEPLLDFAVDAVEPQAKATMTAEFSFREID